METRANYIWVGVVTLALLAALAAFTIWLAQLGAADRKHYDIFFSQSVSGLANGSEVTFSGVPVGQVAKIELWERDPELVRVRIAVQRNAPIVAGTVASISSSFTGVSTINLDGAVKGAPPITCETSSCPAGVPVIPTRPGGLGEILASAPLLLERLTTLTERLSNTLSPQNQKAITGILANSERLTAGLADAAPEMRATLVQLRDTLDQASGTLAAAEETLVSTDRVINREGASLADELRETLAAARKTAASLEAVANAAQPATQELTQETLPATRATLRDLQRTSEKLRELIEDVQDRGAGTLVRGNQLPNYKP